MVVAWGTTRAGPGPPVAPAPGWGVVASLAGPHFNSLYDFREGWEAGWEAARRARADGATWWETVRSRPDDEPEVFPWQRKPPPWDSTEESDVYESPARPESTEPVADEAPGPTVTNQPVPTEGEPEMTAPVTAVTPPQGDSNAAVMAGHLQQISGDQLAISDLVDQLAAARTALNAKVVSANEFAEQTGQTAETRQALDASAAVAAQLGEQIGGVSDSAQEAADQLTAAWAGLRVVEEAEDALTSAGADGRAVAPAGTGA